MRIPVSSAFMLVAMVACTDYKISKTGSDALDDVEEGVCEISATPESIDFGQLAVGVDEPRIETVTVRNDGDAACQIESLELEDADMPFEISAIGSVLIAPATSTSFTVTYAPVLAEESSSKVIIGSNDPDDGFEFVDLTGGGVAPRIVLDPETYDFGSTYVGCDIEAPITIRNEGNADLIVTDISYVTASNDLLFDENYSGNTTTNSPLPWTIKPGGSMVVGALYTPLDEYADTGFVTVTSNDPTHTEAKASQTGNAGVFGENLDIFQQPLRSSADLLFIVDNSCSMAEEQSNLSSNFTTFINTLAFTDADYHIAVITTDNPQFRGDIITPDTSDPVSEFVTQATPGIGGSGDEKPTEMAYQSVQPGGDAGPGSEFLREDSVFSMIFVSDEPDSSPSSVATYLAYFESLRTDTDNYVAHAISGDWPAGCGTASATNIVYDLTVATGGLYLSVCATDWASHLESIAEVAAADLSSFELTDYPVPTTIVVSIDGVATTAGWVYNAPDNAIDFDDDHIPAGGSTIEVEYSLYGDCSG